MAGFHLRSKDEQVLVGAALTQSRDILRGLPVLHL